MAGWRFAFFRFERQFPLLSLRVRWLSAETKAMAYRAEGSVLLTYLRRHCELPPLNYKFNWDVFEELGWRIFDDQPANAKPSESSGRPGGDLADSSSAE